MVDTKIAGLHMKKELSADLLYAKLKERISNGYYPSGLHLVESDLIQEYGFSRTTVREALRRLVDDQMVELIPNKGVHVKRFSNKEILDSYLLYEYLIALCVRIVTERGDKKTISALDKLLTESEKQFNAGNFQAFIDKQTLFHRQLINSTDNEPLIRAAMSQLQIQSMSHNVIPLQARIDVIEYHRKLMQAIRTGNAAQAEKIIREDTTKAREAIMKELSART